MRRVAILSARNEEATVGQVLDELARLGLDDVRVVVNGSTDRTADIARRKGATVLWYGPPLGHDTGRAVGARGVEADAYLFLDADFVLPAEDLAPFLRAVERGVDVALNDLNPYYDPRDLSPVLLAKLFLSHALGRPDLGIASLTSVPHALSRRALAAVGVEALVVPPKAMVRALLAGLRVELAHAVNVHARNRLRPGVNTGPGPHTVEAMIVGDHLEALAELLALRGSRGGFTDLGRLRSAAQAEAPSAALAASPATNPSPYAPPASRRWCRPVAVVSAYPTPSGPSPRRALPHDQGHRNDVDRR